MGHVVINGKDLILNENLLGSKWKTQDNRLLKPSEFDDRHLVNTIKYMVSHCLEYRNQAIDYYKFVHSGVMLPESLIYEEEEILPNFVLHVIDYTLSIDPLEWLAKHSIYKLLVNEACNRGLDISFNDPKEGTWVL